MKVISTKMMTKPWGQDMGGHQRVCVVGTGASLRFWERRMPGRSPKEQLDAEPGPGAWSPEAKGRMRPGGGEVTSSKRS